MTLGPILEIFLAWKNITSIIKNGLEYKFSV